MPESGVQPTPEPPANPEPQISASERVGEAHQLLQRLRQKIHDHPELDLAIERLEEALAALNVRSGGML